VKRISRYLPLLVLLLCSIQLASAQSLIDLNIGFGAVQAKATGNAIEGDYSYNSYFAGNTSYPLFGSACVLPGSTTSTSGLLTCTDGAKTNALSGFMMGFGANLMLWKNFGVGMEVSFQPGKPTYASIPAEAPLLSAGVEVTGGQPAYLLQSRTTFYDFNGIYQPVNTHKATLQLIGGFGGANLKIYENQSSSGGLLGSASNSSLYAGSSNHLNLHGGVGVQIYLNDHMYLRPQFDIHYVPNLQQFGTKLVTQEMVWIGYTIGDRQ
jgi:hypothetical protein